MPGIYGTRLLFSGVESRRLLDTFSDFKVPHIQISYYYLRKVFSDPADAELALKKFETVVIDHGLIYHKYKSEPERKQFLEDYYAYVAVLDPKIYTGVVGHIDLALDKVIDDQKLIYPLEDLEELLDGDMKSIFSNVDYIGVSNKVVQQEDRMSALCSQAIKNGVRLHAFGTASYSVLKKWPIFTANTSSWRTGSRYANTYIYQGLGRPLRLYQPTDKSDLAKTDREKKNIRTRQRSTVETKQPDLYNLINWESLLQDDDSWEVDKANLTQWLLYQRDLQLEGRHAYWLTEDEKRVLAEDKSIAVSGKSLDTTESRSREVSTRQPAQSDVVLDGEIMSQSTELDTAKRPRLTDVDTRLLQPRMCDNCILANRCPKYNPGNSCAFGLTDSYEPAFLDQHISEDVGDLLALQKDRILQGYLEEKADGGGLNKDLNREIRTYLEMVAYYKDATTDSFSASIKAKGTTGIMGMFQMKDRK